MISINENTNDLSLVKTIKESSLSDLTDDLLELPLDKLFADSILEELPIVKSLHALWKTSVSVKQVIELKKLLKFLKEIAIISKEDREREISKIDLDDSYKTKVGEQLLLLLDRQDSLYKPKLLGQFFRSFLNKEIHYETFLDLSYALDKLKIQYLTSINIIPTRKLRKTS